MSDKTNLKSAIFASLPPVANNADQFKQIQAAVKASGRKVVVLDDDPTGSQTVHGINVLTTWDVADLQKALTAQEDVFYILTNTRSMNTAAAASLNAEVARNLCKASQLCGVSFDIISRSDSTLRGHYPLELDVIGTTLQQEANLEFDGHLLIPAFFEGGRYTINNIHYVQEGDKLTPAEDTEFANDAVFGYSSSYMPKYIEEKTAGTVTAEEVVCVQIVDLRLHGSDHVADILLRSPKGARVVVNAADYTDLEVFVLGLLKAEAAGRHYLVRSSASFVRVRGGISPKAYLTGDEVASQTANPHGGLVIVGSYIGKTTAQVEGAKNIDNLNWLEVNVNNLLEISERQNEIDKVKQAVHDSLTNGENIMVYTSRALVKQAGALVNLDIGSKVSAALVEIVATLDVKPRFLIAKGGITSSDLATEALRVKSAVVLGQVAPGISAWKLQEETKFPGISYIVFPGNVGNSELLADLIRLLDGQIERLEPG